MPLHQPLASSLTRWQWLHWHLLSSMLWLAASAESNQKGQFCLPKDNINIFIVPPAVCKKMDSRPATAGIPQPPGLCVSAWYRDLLQGICRRQEAGAAVLTTLRAPQLLPQPDVSLAPAAQETRDEEETTAPALPDREWTKNFASPECGAKIVKASSDIKNPSHVIKNNRDEYLLTECDKQIWFVVELCETIKILRLEVDNHELYSGGPKQLSVSLADKYSSQQRDWLHLGNFTASGDKRRVETFQDFAATAMFARFVRVDVLAHYDEEHYCTITSFRVFGISEYEYLMEDGEQQAGSSITSSLSSMDITVPQMQMRDKISEVSLFEKKEKMTKNSHTIIKSYKHLYMRMRNDICIDSFTLRTLEKESSDTQEDASALSFLHPSSTFQLASMDSTRTDTEESTTTTTTVTTNSSGSSSSSPVINSAPQKESLLVQISNRVKLLEKNATASGSFLRQLNATMQHQTENLDSILQAVIRAKDSFKGSLEEQVAVRGRLKALAERVQQFEVLVEESSQTVKLLMASLLLLGAGGLYLLCCLLGGRDSVLDLALKKTTGVPTKEAATMTDGQIVVSAAAAAAKKVAFRAPQQELQFDLHFGRGDQGGRQRVPSRRVTWCGGRALAKKPVPGLPAVEEKRLEDEILKSILKKAEAGPSLRQGYAQAAPLPGRRVTWCGGSYRLDVGQQRQVRAQEI